MAPSFAALEAESACTAIFRERLDLGVIRMGALDVLMINNRCRGWSWRSPGRWWQKQRHALARHRVDRPQRWLRRMSCLRLARHLLLEQGQGTRRVQIRCPLDEHYRLNIHA